MHDPVALLEEAATARTPCRVGRRAGALDSGVLCRVEPNAGVVVNVPGHVLKVGEEVRLLVELAGSPKHFEGSVLRVAVPVPDRGPDGLLLGFLQLLPAPVEAAVMAPDTRPRLAVVLPGGSRIDLLADPVRLVSVDASGIEFDVPAAFTVIFPENGSLVLETGVGDERHALRGRVRRLVRGDDSLTYAVDVEQIEARDAWQRAIAALRT